MLPSLPEEAEEGDVDMSGDELSDSFELKKKKANGQAREVGAKSARLDTSSSSGGASPELSRNGAWKEAAAKSAKKKNNKKKTKF